MSMPHRRRARSARTHWQFVLVLTTTFVIASCERAANRPTVGALARVDIPAHAYVDPQAVGTYPSSNQRIQGWINAGQTDSIRAHGWDIWQSITTMVNDSTPTW